MSSEKCPLWCNDVNGWKYLPKRTSWLGSQLCGKLVSKRDRAVPPSLHLPRGISSFLASSFLLKIAILTKRYEKKWNMFLHDFKRSTTQFHNTIYYFWGGNRRLFHYFISLVFFLGVQERNGADGLSPSNPDRSESPCSDSQANRFLCFVWQSSYFHPPVQIISDPYLMSRTEKHRLSQPGVETGLHLGMEAGGGCGHGKRAPWRLIAAFIWMCNKLYLANYLHSSDGHKWRFLGLGYLFHQPESNQCSVYSNTARDGHSLLDFLEIQICTSSYVQKSKYIRIYAHIFWLQ